MTQETRGKRTQLGGDFVKREHARRVIPCWLRDMLEHFTTMQIFQAEVERERSLIADRHVGDDSEIIAVERVMVRYEQDLRQLGHARGWL